METIPHKTTLFARSLTASRRPRLRSVLVMCILALAPVLAGCHLRSLLPPPPNPTPGPPIVANRTISDLYGIAMVSATEGWAVGADGTIMHYHDGVWAPYPSPITDTYLLGVSMSTPDAGWIVGAPRYPGPNQQDGTLLHYVNGKWQTVQSPSVFYVNAVQMLPDGTGWAVGKQLMYYNGKYWTTMNTPDSDLLSRTSLSMVSSFLGWAVSSEGFFMKFAGNGQWTQTNQPDPSIKLYAISMDSATDGWAVGEAYDSQGSVPLHALLMHYNGTTWQQVPGPAGDYLYAVQMLSATEGWAMGAGGMIWHYSGGAWRSVSSPTKNTLRAISMISSTEGWAVGTQGTIIHYLNGTWRAYHS